jgi:F0F1-type ATP synthase assembly protein I
MPSDPGNLSRDLSRMSEAGSMLVGPPLLGAFLDWQIWGFPWASVVGLVLGVIFSGRVVYRYYGRGNQS